jgi:hypothetical protein
MRRPIRKVPNVPNENNPPGTNTERSGNEGKATSGSGIEGSGIEVTESAKKQAAEMMEAYEDRPTAVLPGSGNTVTGTAVNDWLDDDGNPKYGNDEKTDKQNQ